MRTLLVRTGQLDLLVGQPTSTSQQLATEYETEFDKMPFHIAINYNYKAKSEKTKNHFNLHQSIAREFFQLVVCLCTNVSGCVPTIWRE